jgi:hypothetical protein
MGLQEALALSLKVLGDWRVLFITVAVLLVWAGLRYVGSVYHRRSPMRPRAPVFRPPRARSAGGKAERGGGGEGEDLVE